MRTLHLLIVIALAASACAPQLPPQDVAERFWRAVVTREPAKIRRYVRAVDQAALKQDADILPVASFELGRVVIDGESATVETSVVLDGDAPLTVPVDTVLVREADAWRVDYQRTIDAISTSSELAGVIEQIDKIGEALKDGIDRSVEGLKEALPRVQRELSRIEQDIERRMPELRERLEEFSRRLEESLEPPPDRTEPDEEQGPIEI